jgi:hypothetical protein
MSEAFDACDVNACAGRELLDRRACADLGLDILGTQHVWNLVAVLGLTWTDPVAAHGGLQSVIGAQDELVAGVGDLADDAFAIDVQSDDHEFTHDDYLPDPPGRRLTA